MSQEVIKRLKISSIKNNEDGTSTLKFDLDKDFVEWFKKDQGLKRFSHRRFQKVISTAIANASSKDADDSSGYVGTVVLAEKEET